MASYGFKNPQKLHGERFDKVVHALLAERVEGGVSRGMARKLIMIGAAYLNGSRCRIASKPVFGGIEVRVEYKADRLPQAQQQNVPDLTQADILYHENGIIVVNKPPRLPTVPTLDNARDNLVAALKRLLSKSADSGETYLGIHHRLDAETSGCILFTTDPAMNVFAAGLFQENLIQKEYLAAVTLKQPVREKIWEIKNELVRAEKKHNRYASTEWLAARGQKGAKPEGSFAFSRFEILQTLEPRALVRAEPVTGRTHQLRVHLSEYGMPIIGDRTYGGEPADRLMLHARRLQFRGSDGKDVVVEAPLPEAFKKLFAAT
jgi:23S rRNA pseudouridine1911/1915/1917 synthase